MTAMNNMSLNFFKAAERGRCAGGPEIALSQSPKEECFLLGANKTVMRWTDYSNPAASGVSWPDPSTRRK